MEDSASWSGGVRLTLVHGDRLAIDGVDLFGKALIWNHATGDCEWTWLRYRADYAERGEHPEFHWQRPYGAGGGCMALAELDALILDAHEGMDQ